MRESCGLFGIFSPKPDPKISRTVYYGLIALQHRGQESAGIAVGDGKKIKYHKGLGLVNDVFDEEVLGELSGHVAIGHVRYSTTGSNVFENAQPIVITDRRGTLAVAHNGNIINTRELRSRLEKKGLPFRSTTDSEIIALLLIEHGPNILHACLDVTRSLQGAYCLLVMDRKSLIAIRDPLGFRPLCMGRLDDCVVFASETVALDAVGAQFVRDIEPGEIVLVNESGVESHTTAFSRSAFCVFEFVYFARPDSVLESVSVYAARERAGRILAIEQPADADLVVGVPDSGTVAAIGYSNQSGIPYGMGLIKNKYIGRTFIQPSQKLRNLGVRLKLNALRELVRGKSVVLVDDSIVRGTTMGQIVKMLRTAGARSIHVRIASPPIRYGCYFGVDTSDRRELIAAVLEEKKIERLIGADSLGYLSLDGLVKAVGLPPGRLCLACFNGAYPLEVPSFCTKYLFEKE
ncbi:MAG: Amidophosphoribosyltransferase [Thermotoga sp. 50_1627]|uniref:amidophosphoribosyltransferase n=1 Tax=Pseudothermotoga sp. TaxID=2033661 RepID=UPI00076C16E0|nr:MAG: Amidophosphoribosyltransferase [Thermotoga sp. 50_64]KUK24168.1 MAG: Amidophosphoribosyltransferase [Thermotoga sp. 50_1627]MBC7115849.1 amidophosphoribosyltransferase [Pseudothermotoga sp.]MDK2923470.1 amidophosphoribosyltransferase [Pseudothermotoga sp.]HBT38841.1 amidophosphoribosyltransferase [Pseudothermotoga sp.]